MSKIRVLIVDDSPFSRTVLAEVLRDGGFEVVGEADSLDSLLTIYREYRPDMVTMDIAMPGEDGFECSKALRLFDPEAKIVLVSSMMDEESEAEARRLGIVGYVQKPVDGEVLIRVITNALAPDTLFAKLAQTGFETFIEALGQSITRMTKTSVNFIGETKLETQYGSQGIAAVIGITGRSTGSMIMDLTSESAEKLAQAVLRREPKNREEVLTMVAELANIVSGMACSMLNKVNKSYGLRVSPPSLFYGAPTEVVNPSIQIRGGYAETEFGPIFIGVGFKKGWEMWM